jgi:hypothetical protein
MCVKCKGLNAQQRKAQHSVAGRKARHHWLTHKCPTCRAPVGVTCNRGAGYVHLARRKLVGYP